MMEYVSFTRVRKLGPGPFGLPRRGESVQQFTGYIRLVEDSAGRQWPEPIKDREGCTILYQTGKGGALEITNGEAGYP